jgi:CubicO group peptidase (beta-lactamase class C family)
MSNGALIQYRAKSLATEAFGPTERHWRLDRDFLKSESYERAVKASVSRLLIDTKVPSLSIAHIEDGAIAFAITYGLQNPWTEATPATLYNIASMTKPISAEVVLRLVKSGKISLDEPMYHYWIDPEIKKDERCKLLTPRIALCHQTGFPNWRSETGGVLAFKCTPGSAYTYSGEGYEYLVRFVEEKTGISFEDWAQSLVFDPAGMQNTSYTKRAWFRGRLAFPRNPHGVSIVPEVSEKLMASHLLYTTATDYAKFMQSVMNLTGVSADLADQRATIQGNWREDARTSESGKDSSSELEYGLGWKIMKFRNQTFLWHRGIDSGLYAICYFSASNRSGTVILTNGANGPRMVRPVMEGLAEDPAFIDCFLARTISAGVCKNTKKCPT